MIAGSKTGKRERETLRAFFHLAPIGVVPAGKPFGLAGGPAPPEVIRDFARDEDVIVFRVRGEALLDRRIADGDLVIAERRPPRRAGDLLVCRLPDGEVTLCRHRGEGVSPELAAGTGGSGEDGGGDRPAPAGTEVLGVVVSFLKKL